MQRKRGRHALLPLFLLAGACGAVGRGGYGYAPQTAGLEVVMPAGAPSITRPYHTVGAAGEGDATEEHDGIDIVAPAGTPVIAAAPGRILRSHLTFLRGNRVVIEHGRGEEGGPVTTEYVHLRRRLVREGDEVARGAPIGELGMTGVTAGYPHLHFMVVLYDGEAAFREGRAVEPHLYWAKGRGMVTCHEPSSPPREKGPALTYPVPCR